ncbi:MAG: hypothetical protein KCHDKBKB_00677 [Elusimicrobia bacterium]|nr:hypothetical protein [Elusimicrobiota bacterium]
MKTIKVAYRTSPYWHTGEQELKGKDYKCKYCGAKLWVSPGNTVYCDEVHPDLKPDEKYNGIILD